MGLPQLVVAGYLTRRPRKMPFLIATSVVRNLAWFALAAAAWSRPPPEALLAIFFACYLVFAVSMGMESVAWIDIFAKVCPGRQRGRVMAVGRTIGNVLSLGAGFLVSRILVGWPFPRNYAVLFLLAALSLTGAVAVFAAIREPVEPAPEPADDAPPGERAVLVQGRRIWREDANFRRLVAARFAFAAYYVAVPFFFRFARDVVGVEEAAIGRFVSASMAGQIVANLVWGYVADRYGKKRVAQAILVIATLLPFYVLATPGLPAWAFLLVYVATGAILAGDMIGWLNLLLAIAPAERRPLYVSLQGTLLVPANLLPLFGGVILNVLPYQVFFPLLALSFAASLWLVSGVRETPPAGAVQGEGG
jgi:MFS family permease